MYKDPNSHTDEIGEILEQKHLDKLIVVHVDIDYFDGKDPNEKLLYFFEYGKILSILEEHILNKS